MSSDFSNLEETLPFTTYDNLSLLKEYNMYNDYNDESLLGEHISNCHVDDLKERQCDFLVGPPKATEDYSVEKLENLNMVGLYINSVKTQSFIRRKRIINK